MCSLELFEICVHEQAAASVTARQRPAQKLQRKAAVDPLVHL